VRKADNLPPSCAVVTKSGNLNFLEPSGPVQACNGTDLPLPLPNKSGNVRITNIEARSCNHRCRRKTKAIKYERVSVALVIQYAMRVRHITLSSVACPAVNILPHYLTNGAIFAKIKLLNIKCVF